MKSEKLLTIKYGTNIKERVGAIKYFSGNMDLKIRAFLNPLLKTNIKVSKRKKHKYCYNYYSKQNNRRW